MVRTLTGLQIAAMAGVLAMPVMASTTAVVRPSDVPPPASGRTLTVGPGAQYATPQAAANAAAPGDNVQIAAGTYSGGLSIKTNGSSGMYVTFYGSGGTAVITGSGGSKGLVAVGNHSWQRFIGLTSKGSSGFGVMANGAHDLVFQDFGVDGSQDGGLVALNTKKHSGRRMRHSRHQRAWHVSRPRSADPRSGVEQPRGQKHQSA
ncbi:hypothetical protein [Fodinicola feengrottensis]|uniref:hypothetical protein n=1 Tax=Fodinicola feengrottensis TaxID=435914 RepID=UPI0013D66289|nr:hypothetical protein [Fodinicola feengrottensis]